MTLAPLQGMRLLPFLLLPSCLAVMACDGTVTNDEQSVGDNTGGAQSQGNGGEGGTESGPGCRELADASARSISVLIKNERSEPIYIGPENPGCGISPIFSWESIDNELGDSVGNSCGYTCEMMMDHGNEVCDASSECQEFKAFVLAPGEIISRPWHASYRKAELLDAQCYPGSSDNDEAVRCDRETLLPDGTYRFSAQASTQVVCGWNQDEVCGSCEVCDSCSVDERDCVLPLATLHGELLHATADFELSDAAGEGEWDLQAVLLTFND